jgi:hypothetical protein
MAALPLTPSGMIIGVSIMIAVAQVGRFPKTFEV